MPPLGADHMPVSNTDRSPDRSTAKSIDRTMRENIDGSLAGNLGNVDGSLVGSLGNVDPKPLMSTPPIMCTQQLSPDGNGNVAVDPERNLAESLEPLGTSKGGEMRIIILPGRMVLARIVVDLLRRGRAVVGPRPMVPLLLSIAESRVALRLVFIMLLLLLSPGGRGPGRGLKAPRQDHDPALLGTLPTPLIT